MAMTTTFKATSVLCMLGLAIAISSIGAAVLVNAAVCTSVGGESLTQEQANAMVDSIRQSGIQGLQCCQSSCSGPDDCIDLLTSPVGPFIGSAQICGACQGCTSCETAGSALNDILSQCGRTINGIERVAGYEGADGFTFVLVAS